jgi:hypothetical protein
VISHVSVLEFKKARGTDRSMKSLHIPERDKLVHLLTPAKLVPRQSSRDGVGTLSAGEQRNLFILTYYYI